MFQPPTVEAFAASLPQEEAEQEVNHFSDVLRSFAAYQVKALRRVQRAQDDMDAALATSHPDLHAHLVHQLTLRRQAILANQRFLDAILSNHDESMSLASNQSARLSQLLSVDEELCDKVRSSLLMCVRDWSADGAEERAHCYGPLLEALQAHMPSGDEQDELKRVLVPGAGAGRLAYEIASLGYAAQGNEFSNHMLILSDFLLNRIDDVNCIPIFPYALQFSNLVSIKDAIHVVMIPDIVPELPERSDMSMTAGDFLDVYGQGDADGTWDAVVTSFFIDTAKNIVEYIERIRALLRPGGVWINNGPLVYHYENTNAVSIEMTMEDILQFTRLSGFSIAEQRTQTCTYSSNPRSMYRVSYQCEFFVAVKS